MTVFQKLIQHWPEPERSTILWFISFLGLVQQERKSEMATKEVVVERKQTTNWYVGDAVIVQENRDGTYSIVDWHFITEERMKLVHSVLGKILTDLAEAKLEAQRILEMPSEQGERQRFPEPF